MYLCIHLFVYLSTFISPYVYTYTCLCNMYVYVILLFFLCMGEGMSYTAETCNVMHCISFCIDLSVLPYRMTRTCILVVQCSSEQGNII